MIKNSVMSWLRVICLIVATAGIFPAANAFTFLSQPAFTPATKAPLAGLLQLTTDIPSRVSVVVTTGTNVWENDFYDFATNHALPLAGFKAATTNLIQVTVHDKHQNAITATQQLKFVTAALPAGFPAGVLLTNKVEEMEPGYTLFMIQNRTVAKNFVVIINNAGVVVWYCTAPAFNDSDVRQLGDGNLFMVDYINKRFLEVDLLGNTVRTWTAPAAYPINVHDGIPTDHGTILYLSDINRTVPNFPSSDTVSNAPLWTANVDDNVVVEISATNSAVLNTWSPLDILQNPTRITYLTYGAATPTVNVDNEHANALIEDPRDNSIIVSLRGQNAVFKFSRATGKLKWILGPPAGWNTNVQANLFTPVGSPFAWNYGQHAPMITPQGTLVMFDDGPYRASPFATSVLDQNNYSRAVEYSLEETNMEISQAWDSTPATSEILFSSIIGEAQWLPHKQNILTTYGYVTYINGVHPSSHSANATMVRIKEYSHDPIPQVVFDLSYFDSTNVSPSYLGYFLYRAKRIPDLYAHLVSPVTDLNVTCENDTPHLQFTADPTENYAIQASPDLINWTEVGTALQEGVPGEFDFYDFDTGGADARFYRVLTEPGE